MPHYSCCKTKHFLGRCSIHVCSSLIGEPTKYKNKDTIKVHLVEPMSFIQVTYKNMGEGLLIGTKITQNHQHNQ